MCVDVRRRRAQAVGGAKAAAGDGIRLSPSAADIRVTMKN
jgi:hypothetical protein